jgi:hypothetical protein
MFIVTESACQYRSKQLQFDRELHIGLQCGLICGNPASLETIMYRVFMPNLNRWIENVPVTEAVVFKEEGYLVERMS